MLARMPTRSLDRSRRTARVVIVGYYGHGNLGDDAILDAVHERLGAVVPRLSLTATAGCRPLPDGIAPIDPRDLTAMSEAIRACDLLVLGGGGLLQDYWPISDDRLLTAQQGGLVQYLAGPVLAHLHDRPSVLLSVGVGPLTTEDGRRQAATAVDLAAVGTVRDAASLALLDELTPDGHSITVAADPAFLLAPVRAADDDQLLALGLPTDRSLYAVAVRPWPPGADARPSWTDEVAAGLDEFVRTAPGHLVLVPFDETSQDTPDDRSLALHLVERLASHDVSILRAGSRPRDIAALLARCDVVLAMRYHAAVLASLSGTPTACLAYDAKVASLADQLGLPSLPVPAWNREAIVEALRAAATSPRSDLSRRAAALTAEAQRAVDIVVERLHDQPTPGHLSPSDRLVRDLALTRSLRLLRATASADQAASTMAVQSSQIAALTAERDAARAETGAARSESEAVRSSLSRFAAERDLARQAQEVAELRLAAAQRQVVDIELASAQARQVDEQAVARARADAEEQIHQLADELAAVQFRLRSADEDLRLVKASPAYRLAAPVWRAGGRVMPMGSRRRAGYHRLIQQLRGFGSGERQADFAVGPVDAVSAPTYLEQLVHFERDLRRHSVSRVVLVLSGTHLQEDEGQRPTQLALELARLGVAVVFAYWRWDTSESCPQDRLQQNIIQVPIDVIVGQAGAVSTLFDGLSRTLLIAFPHPSFFELLARANAAGWNTVYDVLDDWEQFHDVGQAVWWDAEFEEHVTRSVDVVTAINQPLADLVGRPAGRQVHVVPNGLRPGIDKVLEHRTLERGELTIGYFGHLTPAWFDWELLAEAARSEPTWRWYVIGYGGVPSTALPANVVLLGRKPQNALSGYAANWDVGIVPFRRTRLAECADPIKVYEYLAMGLPVVVTGVHPPPGSEQLVLRTDDATSFVAALRQAATGSDDVSSRRQFAADSAWSRRATTLLELAEAPTRPAARR